MNMSPRMKLVLSIVAGIVVGWIVNMSLIVLGPSIVALPEGMDPTNAESYKAHAHLLTAKNYIMPFLAHALGTLAGAFTIAKFAPQSKMKYAMFIGAFFLIGGIAAANMIPAPVWFVALDLIAAYIPMAWIGGRLGSK